MQSDARIFEHKLDAELTVADDSSEQLDQKISQIQASTHQLTGYELIADMLRRQEDVIAELDALNLRIESAIKEITDARKLDDQTAEVVAAEQDLAEVDADSVKQVANAA